MAPTGIAPEVGFGSGDAIPENTRMHFDILTQAFACDRTRYVVARWGETGAGTIPWLFPGDTRDMHGDIAHNAGHENMTDGRRQRSLAAGQGQQLVRPAARRPS